MMHIKSHARWSGYWFPELRTCIFPYNKHRRWVKPRYCTSLTIFCYTNYLSSRRQIGSAKISERYILHLSLRCFEQFMKDEEERRDMYRHSQADINKRTCLVSRYTALPVVYPNWARLMFGNLTTWVVARTYLVIVVEIGSCHFCFCFGITDAKNFIKLCIDSLSQLILFFIYSEGNSLLS